MSKRLIITVVVFLLLGAGVYYFVSHKGGCAAGATVNAKNATLAVVGLEDYKSDQLSGNFCHLTADVGGVTADYYLDEAALAKFRNEARKDIGNGCVVLGIPDTLARTELCFGEEAKTNY